MCSQRSVVSRERGEAGGGTWGQASSLRHFRARPSLQTDKPFPEEGSPPRLRSAFIFWAPQSAAGVTPAPPAWRGQHQHPAAGIPAEGEGKDRLPPRDGCPVVTKHQSCIPTARPRQARGHGDGTAVPRHQRGVPRPLTRLRRHTRYP